MSLTELVERELNNTPYLLEYLQQGLANISAVALSLKAPLERELERKLTESSISMSIRRYLESGKQPTIRKNKFPRSLDISSRSGIYEVALPQSEEARALADRIRKTLTPLRGEWLSIAEGSFEIVIFTSHSATERVKKIIGKTKKTTELNDLGCISVSWPVATKNIPGIYYRVMRALAVKNISVQSFTTIGVEMTLYVKSDVLDISYQALTELLNNRSIFS